MRASRAVSCTRRCSVQRNRGTSEIAKRDARAAHVPGGAAGPGPMVSFARSGLDAPWNPATEAYWNSLKLAMFE